MKNLENYQVSAHKMFTTEKIISPKNKVFEVYKKDITTYNGLQSTRGGQIFIINDCKALTRSSKKGVINFIKNN